MEPYCTDSSNEALKCSSFSPLRRRNGGIESASTGFRLASPAESSQLGVADIADRKATETEKSKSYMESRKRQIDDTDTNTKKDELKRVSPWIAQFTPSAAEQDITEPPKRPPSPFSGRPLKTKDLIPIDLLREAAPSAASASTTSSTVKYICPVSR
jgi:hypothetical protein